MRYINIVGTTGSGKSTFARLLASALQLQYIELDNLLWLDDWQEKPDGEFLAILESQLNTAQNGWVLDGHYTCTTDIIWQQAETVIWLDYAFAVNFYRLVKRTVVRAIDQKPLWENSNNREAFGRMCSKDSILLWMMQHYHKNRKKYLTMMQNPQYQHIRFIHLTSPQQAADFLHRIGDIQ